MTLTVNTSLISHIGSTVLLTLFLILILGIAVCAILSFVPRRPYLDSSSGMIVFGIYSGTFRSTRDKAQVYIYLRNRRHGLVYFEYDGHRYIINQWE